MVFINGGLQSKIDLNQPPYGDESHETYLNALEFHEIDFGSSDVLIIGGGNLGLAKLLLDKGVRGVTIFELDKEVVEIFLEYFPSVAGPTLEDERVKIEYGDGFDRLKLCTEDSFDVIIGDLTVSSALRFAEKEIQDDLISTCKEGGAILTHWADGMLDLNLVFAGFHKACAPHFVCVVEIANYSNLCWSTKPFKSGVEYPSN